MFVVVPATAEHADALNDLIARSARTLSAGFYSEQQIRSAMRWVYHLDRELVDDGTFFVAMHEGRIAGCGGWSRRAPLFHEPAASPHATGTDMLDPATDAARIRAMFVAPEYARQGVGRLLLETSIAAAAAFGFTHLELVATLPGVPLYRAYGFAEVAPEVVMLPDGVQFPCVRMTRSVHLPLTRSVELPRTRSVRPPSSPRLTPQHETS